LVAILLIDLFESRWCWQKQVQVLNRWILGEIDSDPPLHPRWQQRRLIEPTQEVADLTFGIPEAWVTSSSPPRWSFQREQNAVKAVNLKMLTEECAVIVFF
jgi:hypothetical protein